MSASRCEADTFDFRYLAAYGRELVYLRISASRCEADTFDFRYLAAYGRELFPVLFLWRTTNTERKKKYFFIFEATL